MTIGRVSRKAVLLITAILLIGAFVFIKGYSVGKATSPEENKPQHISVSKIAKLGNKEYHLHQLNNGRNVKVWEIGEGRQISLNELQGYQDVGALKKENIQPNADVFETVTLKNNVKALYVEFKEQDGKLMHAVHWSIGQEDPPSGTYFVMYYTNGFNKNEIIDYMNSIEYENAVDEPLTKADLDKLNSVK